MSNTERTVRVGLMSYLDPDGVPRFAQTGAVVTVHPDDVERFDRLNVLPGDEPQDDPAPKRRGRPPKVPNRES